MYINLHASTSERMLNRLAQVVAVTFAVDDRLVDAARRYRVVTRGVDAREPFVMS